MALIAESRSAAGADRAAVFTAKELDELIDVAEVKLAQMEARHHDEVAASNALATGLAKLKRLRGERQRRTLPTRRLRPAFSYSSP